MKNMIVTGQLNMATEKLIMASDADIMPPEKFMRLPNIDIMASEKLIMPPDMNIMASEKFMMLPNIIMMTPFFVIFKSDLGMKALK